jgi:Type IV secretion-system coupling protein DNA-binding domain
MCITTGTYDAFHPHLHVGGIFLYTIPGLEHPTPYTHFSISRILSGMSAPQFSIAQNLAQQDDNRITYFGVTDTRNQRTPFGIKREDRSRHSYVIGKTGMGKSTLLENMAVQDIQNGEGLCFIDPHGGTAEKLLQYIPEERVKDVLYFAPFDMQYPVSFNVLENVEADKRHLVVAGLMSTFEKIWVDAWSARMAYILQNTIASLLEFPGATLLGVNRMYIDKEYRKNVIAKITDPAVRSFWVDEYSKYTDRYAQEATPAIQNKIGQFASNALVRNVIGQEESAFNIRDLMDQKKIFIVNLSKGRVGEGNANLLGSMLITKIYLAAMSRADISAGNMRTIPPFYLYVDEFQNFANKSFADILSEARKYKLALTIAHQYIEQMEEEVASAVFGNVGTMMAFRVGAYDAEVLEKEFAPTFMAPDLVNLGQRQIYLKLMIDGVSSQPFSALTMPPIPEPEISHRDRAVAFSRAQFSRPREEVEKNISDWVGKKYEDPDAPAKEAARQERRATRENEEAPRPTFAQHGGIPRPSYASSSQSRTPATPRTPRPEAMTGGAVSTARSQSPERPARPREEYVRRDDAPHQEVRTYVAPRPTTSTPVSTVPTPSVSPPAQAVGTRRPFTPPRPLPPEKKQESVADLRAVLSRMAPKPTPPAPVIPEVTPAALSTETSVHPPSQTRSPRDDGKSVTDEGKEQLRALLANLKKPPLNPPKQTDASIQSVPIHRKQVHTAASVVKEQATSTPTLASAVSQAQSQQRVRHIPIHEVTAPEPQRPHETHVPIVQVASEEQQVTHNGTQTSEIPDHELRHLIHVEKPHIP